MKFNNINELSYLQLIAAIDRIIDWEMADQFDKIDEDLIIAAANANEEEG